ncbi:hypothetical protein AB0O68_34070 [Streptomyces sp. NPDC087512]|uniref:hypothetical protein n=1 Tax=Streptomyces sp. NPDC087512 TaxID=3155059 RepID=UPI00341F7E15
MSSHSSGHDPPAQLHPENRKLELGGASEERHRPAAVQVYVSPITSCAALRWANADWHISPSL